VRQLEKPDFFLLTLKLTNPIGYQQRKVILPEKCLVRIVHQTTKIDMILKIKNQKSKIKNQKWHYLPAFYVYP
jgi:hypothetical protein